MGSTSVVGALVLALRLPRRRGSGGPAPLVSPPRRGRARRASPLADAGDPLHGPRAGRHLGYLGLRQPEGEHESPHLWLSRLFYEADRGPRLATIPTERPRR